MRKIEAQMIQAVKSGRDWNSGNTTVDVTNDHLTVKLHGNTIAEILPSEPNVLWITDAGWQTTTTKSRLNALLSGVCARGSVFQKDFVWYLERGGDVTEMDRNDAYAVSL